MDRNNLRIQLSRAAGFVGIASMSVLISLPGLSQQSPNNASPTVPSTVKPTNPGGRDAGTTNGGEDLNRVPASNSTQQQNNTTGQPAGTAGENADPTSRPDPVNRVEGRDQGTQERMNTSPSGTSNQPGANQPGATTGGDSNQQVEQNQNNGSTMQQNQTTPGDQTTPRTTQPSPRGTTQSSPRSQSDTNSGSSTDGTSTTQQTPSNGGVRALW